MKKPETRSLNQCTLTPVVNNEKVGDNFPGFKPQRPYLKMGLLNTLISDKRQLPHILPNIKNPDPIILLAIDLMTKGKPLEAAQKIAGVASEKLVHFGEAYLAQETAIMNQSVADAEKAIIELGSRNKTTKATNANSERLIKGIQEIKTLITKQSKSAKEKVAARVSGTQSSANIQEVIGAVENIAKSIVPETQLAFNLGDVQQVMSKQSVKSMNYLANSGFFNFKQYYPVNLLQLVGHNYYYNDWQSKRTARKQNQFRTFANMMKVEPIGFLHLEKLNFTPVGYVLGELVYSLPLTPGETVRVTHREWTRTESEYEKIIEESLESYTEESLTEKTELTNSSEDEQKHSLAFNAGVKVSGGFGPVTLSSEVGFNVNSSETNSRKFSSKNSREVTQKASSRVKKEQKTTFRVTTTTEVEDISYREIKNDSDQVVRWDFNRLMKKWSIELYRFDVRMTYDIVIPEPASYLMRKFIKLNRLRNDLEQAFSLSITPNSVNRYNWQNISAQYGVAIDAPPAETTAVVVNDFNTMSSRTIGYGQVEVKLPQGYIFDTWSATGSEFYKGSDRAGVLDPLISLNSGRLNSGGKDSSSFVWTYLWDWSEPAEAPQGSVLNISIFAKGVLTDQAFREWQSKAYELIVDAAKGQYETKKQGLQREINQLETELFREDSLVLRKIEKEEIMKGVLRWVLGPDFSFYPPELPPLGLSETDDIDIYGSKGEIRENSDYEHLLKHGELIRFLHQAIEWENVIYVLYPYFWTDNTRWDLKQGLFHPEFIHRTFLRAGAARVVLTIRPGFEESFLSFMETLDFGTILPSSHPYITVAKEMKAMAEESYPFTPLANVPPQENLVDKWYEYTPTGAMDVRKGTVLEDLNTDDESAG